MKAFHRLKCGFGIYSSFGMCVSRYIGQFSYCFISHMLTDQQYLRFVDEISSISEHPIKHRLDVGDSSCHGAVVCPTGARVGEASILAFSGVLKHTD